MKAGFIMGYKESRLGDDALIYKKCGEGYEKELAKNLHGKEKLQYFKDYYLLKTIIIIAVVALVISLIYSMVKPKAESVMTAAIYGYSPYADMFDTMETEFGEYLGIDTERESIYLDYSYYLNDSSSQQRLSTYFYVGELDCFIAPESTFQSEGENGMLYDLSDVLPSTDFSRYSDYLLEFATIDDTDLNNPVYGDTGIFGIYLDSLSCFSGTYAEGNRPVIGIVLTSGNVENAIDFIRYLFDTYQ